MMLIACMLFEDVRMPRYLRSMCFTALVCIAWAVATQAETLEQRADVVLSATGNITRWAAIYKILPERPDDPYFHVRVFEHRKGWQPWKFTELAFHMAVTPEALEASRITKKAKTFNYKDVEIRASYRRWLEDPSARTDVPVCSTNILDCVKNLPK